MSVFSISLLLFTNLVDSDDRFEDIEILLRSPSGKMVENGDIV